jgi:hypothetical protein
METKINEKHRKGENNKEIEKKEKTRGNSWNPTMNRRILIPINNSLKSSLIPKIHEIDENKGLGERF